MKAPGNLPAAASALVEARAEEASLACRLSKCPDDQLLYLQWAQARRRVEEAQEAYVGCLDRLGYPDHRIRIVVESYDWF